jgi:hypothetical protein
MSDIIKNPLKLIKNKLMRDYLFILKNKLVLLYIFIKIDNG